MISCSHADEIAPHASAVMRSAAKRIAMRVAADEISIARVDGLHPGVLPIPANVSVDKYWCGQMREMADHIGARDTLLVVSIVGGQRIYIPMDPATNPLQHLIGRAKAAILSQVYGREHMDVPVGRPALNAARRAPVLAAVRSGDISINTACALLRTSRTMLSRTVNNTDEGVGVEPIDIDALLRSIHRPISFAQRDVLLHGAAREAEAILSENDVPKKVIDQVRASILVLAKGPLPLPHSFPDTRSDNPVENSDNGE